MTSTGSPAKGVVKPNRSGPQAAQTGRTVKFDPTTRTLEFNSNTIVDSRVHVAVYSKVVIPKGIFTEKQLQVVIALCKTVNHFTLGHDVSKDVVSPESTDKDGKVIPAKVVPSRIKKLSVLLDAAVVKPTEVKEDVAS